MAELNSGVDIARVSVAALTERAGLTRRTFYSHYKDIPDFIEQVENGLFDEIRVRVRAIAEATLPDLYKNIEHLEPASASAPLPRRRCPICTRTSSASSRHPARSSC